MFVKFRLQQLIWHNYHIGSDKSRLCSHCSIFLKYLRFDNYIIKLSWTYMGFKKFLFLLKSSAQRRGLFWFLSRDTYIGYIVKHFCKLCGNLALISPGYGGYLSNATFVYKFTKSGTFLKDWPNWVKKGNARYFPSAAILGDSSKSPTVPYDANKIGIPLGALCDSDMLPVYYNYILVGNSKSFFSNAFLCKLASFSIFLGKTTEYKRFLQLKKKNLNFKILPVRKFPPM